MKRGQPLTGYRKLISEATGSSDPALLALVEDFMRLDHSTLDHLSRDRFAHEARQAHADILTWHEAGPVNGGTLADYCASAGLACPTLAGRA